MSTDTDVLDSPAPAPRRGLIVRTITLPFRLTAGVVRAIFAVVGFFVSLLLLPIRIAYAICAKVVGAAADVTYAIWRVIVGILRGIFAAVAFIVRTIARTVGGIIRLVVGLLKLPFRLVFGAFRLGTKVGAGKAAGSAAATAAVAKAGSTLTSPGRKAA